MRATLVALLLLATPAHAAIDPVAAQRAFDELRVMCDRDAGRLWGVSLAGPTLFVERDTRAVAANQPPPAATLPKELGIANTAIDWGGFHWTMVVWPLPPDDYARKVLLAHESFHRVQAGLGFPSTGPENAHLDTVEGRTLLELEWRALAAALRADSAQRRRAIADALHFRERRRAGFTAAASQEHDLEMNEGLAAYTGTVFAEPTLAARVPHIVQNLQDAERAQTFVRSFAYASGPAYGALLDAVDPTWTRKLNAADDFGILVSRSYRVTASASVDSFAYDGIALAAAEGKRDAERQARLRTFESRFLGDSTLALPLVHMNFQFDPNQAAAFPGHGTVYPTLHLTDDWGAIVVKHGGALVTSDWSKLIVPRPPSDDYTLTLAEGWEVVDGTLRRVTR
jgi:hypothetical protein